jgi:hypothetical protein
MQTPRLWGRVMGGKLRALAMAIWPVLPALIAHDLLGRVLLSTNLVATLLSPGAHTPWLALITALFFVLVRVATVCVLPMWISFRVLRALLWSSERGHLGGSSAPVA